MNKQDKIYVAGHTGMVGSAIVRRLESEGFTSIVKRSSSELDLRNQSDVHDFFASERPAYVFLTAAKVGGILVNDTYKADFIYDNLTIQTNVIHQSHESGVKKLLFLGSSCVYPKLAPQPLKEEYLLTGALEPTNEPYAIAKIAGIKMCDAYRDQYDRDFISVMPPNLYGPNDNFDLNNSHVLAALMRKFHEAKLSGARTVELWGTGKPMREFMHVDDLARACVFLMTNYSESGFINVGTGKEISIYELALLIKKIVGYDGEIKFDHTRPDGTPRKVMDISKIEALGYHAQIGLTEGITNMYKQTFKS
ncbi:GDP-L-fucose synthase [Fulvivirga ulvae]|uniref:GDP-L-fucose synthase family protein n=1 Tax=Fulvivirga ulvae TaxID=2904245 RepID=UPI001F31A101|nr:GDP-L-fucose synthase [Fulvivirga ulvae]UII32994.1 GDP-L-fucose synthase [Fulvivirga ulvae]